MEPQQRLIAALVLIALILGVLLVVTRSGFDSSSSQQQQHAGSASSSLASNSAAANYLLGTGKKTTTTAKRPPSVIVVPPASSPQEEDGDNKEHQQLLPPAAADAEIVQQQQQDSNDFIPIAHVADAPAEFFQQQQQRQRANSDTRRKKGRNNPQRLDVAAVASALADFKPIGAGTYTVEHLRREFNASSTSYVMTSTSTASNGKLLLRVKFVAAGSADVDILKNGNSQHQTMQQCGKNKGRHGYFWRYATQSCEVMPGFYAPLQSYEASVEELSCSDESLYETAAANLQGKTKFGSSFVKFGFSDFSDADGVLKRFNIDKSAIQQQFPSSAAAASVERDYSRFMFYSSWMLREWQPWKPLPVATPAALLTGATLTAANADKFKYRAMHDATLDNLFRIENFCVAPFGGLSGYAPVTGTYHGLDDSRGKFHPDSQFKGFFRKVKVLSQPASYYDERPVFFMSSMPMSRPNQFHNTVKFFGMLAILDAVPAFSRHSATEPEQFVFNQGTGTAAGAGEFAPGSTTEHWNPIQKVKPLVIFVFARMTRRKYNVDRTRTTAFAFLFRTLDLPWAVVNTRDDPAEFMADVFKITRHNAAYSSKSGRNDSYHDLTPFCARRAVVYQNCRYCEWTKPHHDTESYSFGDFAFLNSQRRSTVQRYLRLLVNCILPMRMAPMVAAAASALSPPQLFVTSNSYGSNPSLIVPKNKFELPRVFFSVRAAARTIANFPLIADLIQDGVKDFVSEVVFREPWRGSRAAFITDVRNSDIWIGNHGGSFAEVPLLRPRPVVIEFQDKVFACRNPGCWFEPLVDVSRGAHWIFQVTQENVCCGSFGPTANKTFHVPASAIIDILRDAVCRWYTQNPEQVIPSEKVRLYRKFLSPVAPGASKYRSTVFHEMNGGAGAAFATNAVEVSRVLREQFGLEMNDQRALTQMIERLRSINSKKDARLLENGALRSEAPALFKELVQRFVDNAIGVWPLGGLSSKSARTEVLCLEIVSASRDSSPEKVCLYAF